MSEKIRAGFLGLGDMGGPMAANLIAKGFPTTLWARRDASLEPYAGMDYRRAGDLAALGAASDVVGVCVFGDADVREVVLGERGILAGMAQGGVILIHATIMVETAEELTAAATARGVAILDAPVSGARQRSIDGTLSIMVGGDEAAFEKALPVMRAYGGEVRRLGPVGSGLKMKAVNNVLGFVNLRTAWLAIETAQALGLDRDAVIAMLRASSGASFNLHILAERLIPDPGFARHASTMTEKDTRIFQKICASAGVERSSLDGLAEEAIDLVVALGERA